APGGRLPLRAPEHGRAEAAQHQRRDRGRQEDHRAPSPRPHTAGRRSTAHADPVRIAETSRTVSILAWGKGTARAGPPGPRTGRAAALILANGSVVGKGWQVVAGDDERVGAVMAGPGLGEGEGEDEGGGGCETRGPRRWWRRGGPRSTPRRGPRRAVATRGSANSSQAGARCWGIAPHGFRRRPTDRRRRRRQIVGARLDAPERKGAGHAHGQRDHADGSGDRVSGDDGAGAGAALGGAWHHG